MNFFFLAKTALFLCGVALVLYGLHQPINAAAGLEASFLNSPLQLLAFAVGTSIVWAFAYPHVRGVRKGDRLAALIQRQHNSPFGAISFVDSVPITALESGRVGRKIKVSVRGRRGEAVITAYASTFSPATVQVTETETDASEARA